MSADKPNLLVLSDFRLVQAHVELRTAPKFLHWDRAGSIWSEMTERVPRLTMVQAEPNRTAFSLDNKYVFTILQDTSAANPFTATIGTANNPHSSLKEFGEFLEIFVAITQNQLRIDDYSRVGLRLMFHKSYKDKESASRALLSTNLLRIPEGPCFGIKGPITLPIYSIRLEEGKNGVAFGLKVESFNFDFIPPPDWEGIDAVHKKNDRLTFDIDSYTLGPIVVGQFNIAEWINQRLHLVTRDSDKLFRGI